MDELINQIAAWVETLILAVGYPGIFAIMFIENLFPPMPSDPVIPFAGILAAQGHLTFAGVWAAAVLGATGGSIVMYGVGRWANEAVIRGLVRKYGRYLTISEAELDLALAQFNKRGGIVVFTGRILPVIRSVVSLAAGMSGMPLPKFVLFTAASSTLVSGVWLTLGYILGENWVLVIEIIGAFEPLFIALAVMGALIVGYLYVRRRLAQRQPAVPPTDQLPQMGD